MEKLKEDFLTQMQAQIDRAMQSFLVANGIHDETLYEAMRYSVFAGGKRLRPALILSTVLDLGGALESALPAACAIEFVHTYSLIHDDLPAMDNDDFRRGRPTNHKMFGEAPAILAGDGLLTLAFEVVCASPLPSDRVVAIVRELAQASGPKGMVGGQMADISYESKPIKADVLAYIHDHKTGALLTAAVRMGALIADADVHTLQHLTYFGQAIGLAFQIMDDILDITGDEHVIGKSVGSDQALGKATYPALYGLDASVRKVKELTDEALSSLSRVGPEVTCDRLRHIANALVKRDR